MKSRLSWISIPAILIFALLAPLSPSVAGAPQGLAAGSLTQDQVKSDFALLFTEQNAGGYYKPTFSGFMNYENYVGYVAVLPRCEEDPNHPCIKAFEASIDDGKTWIKPDETKSYVAKSFDQANYPKGSIVQQTKNYVGDSKTLLPSGTDAIVYTFSKAGHYGGGEYLLQPIIEGTSSAVENLSKASKLSLSIIPIKTYSAPNPNNCSLWVTTCFDVYSFKSNVKFRVVLDLKYLSPTFSGWFQSRIRESSIEQDNQTIFTFEGYPIEVSTVLAEFNKPFPQLLLLAYPDAQTGLIAGKYQYKLQQVLSNTNAGIKDWINNESYIPTKARWDSTIWTATSYSTSSSGYIYTQMNGCLQTAKGLLGQVSTNATVYTISAPLWDAASQSLLFTVAAPTYESDGKKKEGLYDLALREDVARCLWGSNIGNSQAKIEILNTDGSNQVATTSFKITKGYVYFRAAGFHYSVPKIRVTLDASNLVPSPTPTVTPVPKPSSISSIKCFKGKLTKTVSGSKCPSGYKKKS